MKNLLNLGDDIDLNEKFAMIFTLLTFISCSVSLRLQRLRIE